MLSTKGSIADLEKSSKLLAKRFEREGLKVEHTVFKCGPGGDSLYGPSHITLTVETSGGKDLIDIRIYAGGYGTVKKWSEIKKDIILAIRTKQKIL